MFHTISVIYRKPGNKQKYITFCRMPGDHFDEYFTKQVCMNYGVEYVSSQMEENPDRRLSKKEKEKLGVIRKSFDFFEGKLRLMRKFDYHGDDV